MSQNRIEQGWQIEVATDPKNLYALESPLACFPNDEVIPQTAEPQSANNKKGILFVAEEILTGTRPIDQSLQPKTIFDRPLAQLKIQGGKIDPLTGARNPPSHR